ncbi:hypothetical protein LDENG_00101260 [Lucifuga dentata]|nr:hypothetical protein LDENG_00101260 [Lucifuga dentata]
MAALGAPCPAWMCSRRADREHTPHCDMFSWVLHGPRSVFTLQSPNNDPLHRGVCPAYRSDHIWAFPRTIFGNIRHDRSLYKSGNPQKSRWSPSSTPVTSPRVKTRIRGKHTHVTYDCSSFMIQKLN